MSSSCFLYAQISNNDMSDLFQLYMYITVDLFHSCRSITYCVFLKNQ